MLHRQSADPYVYHPGKKLSLKQHPYQEAILNHPVHRRWYNDILQSLPGTRVSVHNWHRRLADNSGHGVIAQVRRGVPEACSGGPGTIAGRPEACAGGPGT
jgi:hypothetical protein